ncbi:MAG: threonine synthase [Flavobacteriaceae bacterium]|nr:threonine synthase [Flavobacteriaceae bacterium]
MRFISNKGGGQPVDFETAILDGFAADGGLYVPESIPKISTAQLQQWQQLDYINLAYEILSLYIDKSILNEGELKDILQTAYQDFEKDDIIPIHQLTSRPQTFIMELFHGPTISFKDIGLAFLVNLVNYFLKRKNDTLSLVVATTGDTGPATAYFAAGKSNLQAWVLYPKDMITREQERQMTTLPHHNVHPVAVSNCPEGGDDLDLVIAKLYANKKFKETLKLSSVNSINWGRIMMQTVHYFYGYFKVVNTIGEPINMSVPSGGFGNLCAGGLARKMGLPINYFIAANNENDSLNRIFSNGVFTKAPMQQTLSSAIDILIPYNFLRYLYIAGVETTAIKNIIDEFNRTGHVAFNKELQHIFNDGFISNKASDTETLNIIKDVFDTDNYLLDPHGAVAVVAAETYKNRFKDMKMICLATAHPAKFPKVIKQALQINELPNQGTHFSIEAAKSKCEKVYLCDHHNLERALIHIMETDWHLNH